LTEISKSEIISIVEGRGIEGSILSVHGQTGGIPVGATGAAPDKKIRDRGQEGTMAGGVHQTCARGIALKSSISGIALALLMAAPAHAQQPPVTNATEEAVDESGLADIVVTAQFRATNVQSTPIAITAVNAELMQQRSQNTIDQVAVQAPNVTMKAQGGAWGPSLAVIIRGVGGQIDPNPGFSPGIGMYVDDVFYTSMVGSVFDLLDLDRVEILRGPQGTTAGANSIGGAVKLYTKKPEGDGGYVSVTYGSRNRIDVRASGDFTIVPDKLYARVSGATRHQRGYMKRIDYECENPGSGLPSFAQAGDCVLGHQGGVSYSAARGMIRWLPTEDLEINVSADVTDDSSEGGAVTNLRANNPNPNVSLNGVPFDSRFVPKDPYTTYGSFYMPGGPIGGVNTLPLTAEDRSIYRGWGTATTIDWGFADGMSIKSITAYRKFHAKWASDVDSSPLPLGLDLEDIRNNQFSQELRLSGGIADDAIEYTVGGYYLKRKGHYTPHQYFIYNNPSYDYVSDDRIRNRSLAGFANVVWHVTDRFNVTGGLRYTHEKKSFAYGRYDRFGNPAGGGLAVLNGVVGRYNDGRLDWSISADYEVVDDTMVYGSASTGYRSGGVTPRPFVPQQARPFGPEEVTAYEIGIKSTLFDRRLRLNLAGFFNELKGVQFTLLTCPEFSPPGFFSCGVVTNAGDGHVRGVELEATAEPVDNLLFDASVSYLKFNYTKLNPGVGIIEDVRPYTPSWKWSVGAQYQFDLGDVGSLTPRVDVAYTSAVYSSNRKRPTGRIAGYTIANARVTWKSADDNWEAGLEVTNLTDKLYYVINADLSFIPSIGYTWATPARPREWALTVKRKF